MLKRLSKSARTKMQVAIVITLLSFCVTLAIPVPVEKNDQSRVERTLSIEELESELEDIENRVDAVRKKVKEEPTENSKHTTGIVPTPSTENNVEINVKSEKAKAVEGTRKPDEIHVVVERITKPSPEVTSKSTNTGITPTLTAGSTASIKIQVEKLKPGEGEGEEKNKEKSESGIKVEKIVTPEESKTEVEVEKVPSAKSEKGKENTGGTVSVEKISVEKEVDGGANGEEEEEKSTSNVVVEKVEAKENEKEEKVPAQISVEKEVANDEEEDPEAGETGKSDKSETVVSVEKISPDRKTEVKEKLPVDAVSVSVEKVTDKTKEKPDETVNGPNEITVEKVPNDKEEVEEQMKERKERQEEEMDLENGQMGDKEKAESENKPKVQVEVVEEIEKKEPIPDQVKVEKVSSDAAEENVKVTVEKIEQQEAEEEKDMQVKVEKLPVETPSAKENPHAAVKVEKVQPSDETDDNVEPKVELTVKKLETAEATMKPTVKTKAIDEEVKTHSKQPLSEPPPASAVKVEKITPEEEDLENGRSNVKAEVEKLPNKENEILGDASLRADSSQNEEEELESEQEQELEKEEETPKERKIALEFEKALEAERNKKENPKTEAVTPSSPIATVKMQTTTSKASVSGKGPENQTIKPASETESKGGMSIEELELAALADKTLNDDDKEERTPLPSTKMPLTTALPAAAAVEKVVVVTEEKHPEITVTVTKEKNEKLLTEKETAQEEKELKEELAKELEQEKTGPPPVIDKITKITDKPEIKATTQKVQEAPDVNLNNEETNNEPKKEAEPEREIGNEQELELES